MKTQYALVGTWKMSLDGLRDGADLLKDGAPVGDAIETAIRSVEENPSYVSVGYGGLPARDGQVYLDSAYMDGNSLRCGAVLSVTDLSSPIAVSRRLCGRRTNWMLAGDGARAFAQACGIPLRDMRTPASRERWEKAMEHFHETEALTAYRGHDTVCVLGVDLYGSMASGTSTSGLFLKEPGRVGDSPIPGCGYYCDTRYGAAAATGLGEDIMRGCLSYEIVRSMREGLTPQEACERALSEFVSRKKQLGEDAGSISLIALAPDGAFGASTTEALFPLTYACPSGTVLLTCEPGENRMILREAAPEELEGHD